jgi:putative flippase GtrA
MAIRKRIRKKIIQTLEKRFMRYLIAAGVATLVDIAVYALVYAYVFTQKEYFRITPDVAITGEFLSILVSYHCGLLVNFTISKFFVFQESGLRTGTQFARFVLVAEIVFVANFLTTRFLWSLIPGLLGIADKRILAFIIRTLSAGTIGVLSFVLHKMFSFEVQRAVEEAHNLPDDGSDEQE